MKKPLLALLPIVFLTSNVYAGTIFSCTVQSGKQVKVTQNGNTVNYRFGKNLNNPEISINVPIHRLKYDFRKHFGGIGGEALGIPNGSYLYVIYSGEGDTGPFGALSVLKSNNYQSIADFDCRPGHISHIYKISDSATYDGNLF